MGIVRIIAFVLLPIILSAQDWPRFELYQLKQGIDSGQFVTTGVDSNLDFNSVLRFRFQDSTLLIGADTVITDATIVPILLATIDAGLGIEVNQVNGQIFIESLSIEDSIYNGSGSIIAKGTPLYAADTQGNYWDVAPARADNPSKMPVVVIAGEEIGIGEVGLGLIKGHIKQVNTTDLADGSQVYVGATGGYTSTKPTDEGVIIQRLGTVIKGETTNGSGIINLGDEGFWNDYTSLTKLRDTLVLVRNSITAEISDSLTNYASKTELADTANNIRLSIPIQIADSLVNYATKVELGDTALAIRSDIPIYISDSLLNYVSRIELGDSLDLYPNRTELGDTALAIRADFSTGSGDVTTAQLADTALAIRGDIPSIPITLGTQTSGNYVATATTSGAGISGSVTGEGSTFTVTSNATSNVVANTIALRDGGGALYANWFGGNNFYGLSEKAAKLSPGANINTVKFDGTQNITINAETYIPLIDGFGIKDFTWSGNTLREVEIDTANADLKTYILNNSAGGGDVTTAQLADTALAIRADILSTSTIVLSATIRDLDSDSVLLMTIPTEYIGCQIIETAQSFFANDFTGASGVFLGSISGSTFTNNGNLIAETVSGAVGYHHYVRNTTSGVYVYPYTITVTSRFIRMNRPAATSGSAKAVTNTITIECTN